MENNYSVYMHTNKTNGKVYIGITGVGVEKRWKNGKGYLAKKKNGDFNQPVFANAIIKYSFDGFIHEVLYTGLSKEEAEQKEIELISFYKSTDPKFGYNICSGGNLRDNLGKFVLCLETGIVYESTSQAERETGVFHSNISKACSGKRKTAGSFHWRYVE